MTTSQVSPKGLGKKTSALSEDIDHCQSFDELNGQYNFLNFSSYPRVLASLILGEIQKVPSPARVLDVGCGRGIGRQLQPQQEIHEAAGEFWGIEPDTSVQPAEGLFDNFQYALMETAELPENSFDLVYSSMVMEHVADPDAFLSALHRCLKPGGVYLFLTPNAQSFVPCVTKFCHDSHIDEFVLRLVRSSQHVEEYHYPVQFKFNTPRLIDGYAERMGFQTPSYVYIEGNGPRSYFPGPLRLIYRLLAAKRKLVKNPQSLATMICRLRKRS
jgi:ubiquinone/menaquinone biosynthesis C-methylase UbiE